MILGKWEEFIKKENDARKNERKFPKKRILPEKLYKILKKDIIARKTMENSKKRE